MKQMDTSATIWAKVMISRWSSTAHPRSQRRVRFLKKVPQALLDPAKGPRPEELWLLHLILWGVKEPGLEHHLLHPVQGHQLASLVVALLAARLQVELVDAPVVEVLLEGNHATLLRIGRWSYFHLQWLSEGIYYHQERLSLWLSFLWAAALKLRIGNGSILQVP